MNFASDNNSVQLYQLELFFRLRRRPPPPVIKAKKNAMIVCGSCYVYVLWLIGSKLERVDRYCDKPEMHTWLFFSKTIHSP